MNYIFKMQHHIHQKNKNSIKFVRNMFSPVLEFTKTTKCGPFLRSAHKYASWYTQVSAIEEGKHLIRPNQAAMQEK